MTTTVTIAISGNKAVRVKTPQGDMLMQPGRHWNFLIHGEQELGIREHGEFITPPPGAVPMLPVAAALGGPGEPD